MNELQFSLGQKVYWRNSVHKIIGIDSDTALSLNYFVGDELGYSLGLNIDYLTKRLRGVNNTTKGFWVSGQDLTPITKYDTLPNTPDLIDNGLFFDIKTTPKQQTFNQLPMNQTLTVTPGMYNEMLPGLIKSGVTFTAKQVDDNIVITYLGGY